MGQVGAVADQGRFVRGGGKAVPDPRGDAQKAVMVGAAQIQFPQHAAGGRIGAGVIEHEFQQAVGHGVVLGLAAVAFPGLDGPGQDLGEIDLAQMQFPVRRLGGGAQGRVGAQHVHHRAAGGSDDLQGLEADTVDAHVRARMFGTFHGDVLSGRRTRPEDRAGGLISSRAARAVRRRSHRPRSGPG